MVHVRRQVEEEVVADCLVGVSVTKMALGEVHLIGLGRSRTGFVSEVVESEIEWLRVY